MRVLAVYCHPNPNSLIAAARQRALSGLRTAGHEVRLTDLYADGFDPTMTADEHRADRQPGVTPELARYADDLAWGEALVLIYPTWWSGQPAMLKGWIDRVWVEGVAWEMREGDRTPTPKLRNLRQIVVVTTHGSSKLLNALEGESGKRTVTRSIRTMCARRARTTWCALYGVDTCDEQRRIDFLDRVESTLADL